MAGVARKALEAETGKPVATSQNAESFRRLVTDILTDTATSAGPPEEKGGIVLKGNIHKKMTFEDKFDRKYACWVKNHPKAWHWYKVQNRKLFRRKVSQEEKE